MYIVNPKPCAEVTKVPLGYRVAVSPDGFQFYVQTWWRPTEKSANKTAKRLVDAAKRRIERDNKKTRIY